MKRIQVHNIGPIVEARVESGAGRSAGHRKSIFLQLLKLVVDKRVIHDELQRFGIDWTDERDGFLEVYFGEGMAKLWTEGPSKLFVDYQASSLRATQVVLRRNRSRNVIHPCTAGAQFPRRHHETNHRLLLRGPLSAARLQRSDRPVGAERVQLLHRNIPAPKTLERRL